ncbi:hypothetical protein HAX54_007214 [Datura stramonium]|uniref:Uncharacterized protein n=1 Tax=Datura stramonium TaxID=4076 RepID=A0ABS8RUU7_DATST|nr:hypothetical protein [Datura stramonium]
MALSKAPPSTLEPQLEVTPITKYASDPSFVLGRKIAVNKTYICCGLKLGLIRVININTALRLLLKGLAQVYICKITEGPDEEEKPRITGRIVIAIQIVLLTSWLMGVQLIGNHDGEVTDLSMCQWMITCLVSASVDGMIKIWEDRKPLPIAVLRPHDGHPVSSVTFLAAPTTPRSHHTHHWGVGPLNREIKIWASASEEGWLLPSDAVSRRCTQTLELKSTAEANVEEAFFNQVVALCQAGLLLLANAKKNAIYAVHLEYGANPEATPMIVEVYCVQTQGIQQYTLDLSQCLPPPTEGVA